MAGSSGQNQSEGGHHAVAYTAQQLTLFAFTATQNMWLLKRERDIGLTVKGMYVLVIVGQT